MKAQCLFCNAEFDRPAKGRAKLYCTDQCRRAAQNRRRGSATPKPALRQLAAKAKPAEVDAWREYVLSTWSLDRVERRLLDLICDTWTLYQRCRQTIEAEGPTIMPERKNGVPRERPEVRVMERSRADFAKFVAQLGLESAGAPRDEEKENG